jgi:3-isopropylmalate dehydrogenase
MLRSLALLLEHALDRPELARALEASVDEVLATHPTPDQGGTASTAEFGDAVLASLSVPAVR